MEIDPTLLGKIQSDNEEFKTLYADHMKLKGRVEELNKLKILSPEQEVEKKTIKKQKLKNKDRMTELLDQYQASLH